MIYFEYIKNTFRSQWSYRLNWIMKILGNVIFIYLQICLWKALISGRENVVSMDYMLGYILFSAMIQALVQGDIIGTVNQKIYSGQIAMDIIKPIRFRTCIFCEYIGNSLFSFLFQYLPVVIAVTILCNCYGIWASIDVYFVLSVLLGVYLYFSIAYCLALTSFWWTQTWILNRFLNDFINMFSGKVIPIWMFPVSIAVLNRFLPFQYIYYIPIAMLLNEKSIDEKMYWIVAQMIWCVVFTLLGFIMEHRGMYKLQVQGG